MRLTIGIKALNEERRIAACIESALAVTEKYDGEVILADSGSTDHTIEIASQYPIRVVQLTNLSERCCGAGAQLAFQHARGDFFLLVDGDMVLSADFVNAGLAFLAANTECAGVGGYVREMNLDNEDFKIRVQRLSADRNRVPGFVDRLDGGGIYRACAVNEVGCFADRNLHGSEESELALRLRRRGWKLARIDQRAVDHFGYQIGGYRLLRHRIRSGYVAAFGEVMRACWSNRQFLDLLKHHEHVRFCLAVVLWWVLICTAAAVSSWAALLLLISPLGYLSMRRRSVNLGIYSYLTWNVFAAGMICGLMRKRISPAVPLAFVELQPNLETDEGRAAHTSDGPEFPGRFPADGQRAVTAESDWPEYEELGFSQVGELPLERELSK